MLHCFSYKNSISFLLWTSPKKYLSRNSCLKLFQVILILVASNHWCALSHQYLASSGNICILNITIWAFVQAITRKILLTSWIQLWAPSHHTSLWSYADCSSETFPAHKIHQLHHVDSNLPAKLHFPAPLHGPLCLKHKQLHNHSFQPFFSCTII